MKATISIKCKVTEEQADALQTLQKGLPVIYINPAYTSQTCSHCDQRGERLGNTFKCSCGNQQHSDLNASRNLCRFARSLDLATCAVNRTQVAAL